MDTTPGTRILIYDDSPVFGGHEVMTLLAVEAMAQQTDWKLNFFATPSNSRLMTQLQTLSAKYPSLQITQLNHAFHRLQGILNHVQSGRISRLAKEFSTVAPNLALIIQGDIEISSTGLLAARRAGIPSVSYIPLPHNQVEKGAKYGIVRDMFSGNLYSVPDGFITISTVLGEMLKSKGATAPVRIVYNGIDVDNFRPVDRKSARTTLNLPEDAPIIGIAGRLERKQKQQQLLIEAISGQSPPLGPLGESHAAFCGDGKDREYLQNLVNQLNVADRTHFLEWRDDLATFYSALDILAIPSRYEGVPLVMLEALCCGTPVVAGNRDGMKEMLPPEWLFEPGDTTGFRKAISTILSPPEVTRNQVTQLQSRIRKTMTIKTFGTSFTKAVAEFSQEFKT